MTTKSTRKPREAAPTNVVVFTGVRVVSRFKTPLRPGNEVSEGFCAGWNAGQMKHSTHGEVIDFAAMKRTLRPAKKVEISMADPGFLMWAYYENNLRLRTCAHYNDQEKLTDLFDRYVAMRNAEAMP